MGSPIPHPLALSALDQDVEIFGDPDGIHNLILAFDILPAAGTVVVKYREPWSTTFTTLQHANGISVANWPIALRIDGAVAVVRVTFSGLSGGVGAKLWFSTGQFPIGLYNGLAAITVQPYTETNVKNGLQFYARAVWPLLDPILAGTTRKIYARTGSKQILVKLRGLDYVAEELEIKVFFGPTGASGGTALTIHNYNAVSPVATTVQEIRKNVTTVTDGTEIDGIDDEHFFGATAAGNRIQSNTPLGIDRVLPTNSEILIALTNTGTGSARAQYFLTWYEGFPDMPL